MTSKPPAILANRIETREIPNNDPPQFERLAAAVARLLVVNFLNRSKKEKGE